MRSVPWDGEVWGVYLRSLESVENSQLGEVEGEEEEEEEEERGKESVEEVFERALGVKSLRFGQGYEYFLHSPSTSSTSHPHSTSTSTSTPVDSSSTHKREAVNSLISLILAKASYERRKIEEGDESAFGRCVLVVERGIHIVRGLEEDGEGEGEEGGEGEDRAKRKERKERKEREKEKRGRKRVEGDLCLRLEYFLSDLVRSLLPIPSLSSPTFFFSIKPPLIPFIPSNLMHVFNTRIVPNGI